MRIRMGSGLLPLNLLVVLLIVFVVLAPSDVLRIILGLPFLLFFPGFVLTLALFPREEGLGGIERAAISFGLSIAIVPLLGLVLNYTDWGVTLESVLYSLAALILVLSVIGWLRLLQLPPEERFNADFTLSLPGWGGGFGEKLLSILLSISILAALGMLVYVVAVPDEGETFTEFYVLDEDGLTVHYPKNLTVGETGSVIIGIINQEQEAVTYRVVVTINGVFNNELAAVTLDYEEEWEGKLDFAPDLAGESQKVEFLLFIGDGTEAYLTLFLYIDVV